jgi:transposase
MQGIDPKRLVFIDETSIKTNMVRTRGRALRGERVVDHSPQGHWNTTTFTGALRTTGMTAPAVCDGPMNGEFFVAYVEQQLAPTLEPGDIVAMDNLSSHKVAGVKETIEAVGATVAYLPPYSPDLNPIEMSFSKLKTLLRGHAKRTQEGLWNCVGSLIEQFTPSECSNYFRHAGYQPQQT